MYTPTTQSTGRTRHRQEENTFLSDALSYVVIIGSAIVMYHLLTDRELAETSSHKYTRSKESTLIKQAGL